MAPANKLLLEIRGEPLVHRVARVALEAGLDPVVAVTGHDADAVREALHGLRLEPVHNPAYAEGIASSLRAGLRALPPAVEAAVVLLGDMPRIDVRHLRTLMGAFDPGRGASVCVPTWQGTRGNPVLWGAAHFPELLALRGDRGARGLLAAHADSLREVTMPDDAVLHDVDDAAALALAAH
jgi:molybdenum cofactor cytidylyltransferase